MKRYEDFSIGEVIPFGTHSVSETEIVGFASQFDPQDMHIDADLAKQSPMGELIASGWHTCSIAMRLACDAYIRDSSCVAAPGVRELRWLAPVRPGDTLTGSAEILGKRRSASRPDRGLVKSRVTLTNQHGTQVLEMETAAIYMR